MEQLANPEAATAAAREAERAAREWAKWERERAAEHEERERERAEQRREHREQNGHSDRSTARSPPRGEGGGGAAAENGTGTDGGSGARRWRREDMAYMRARTWSEYDVTFGAWRERAGRTGAFSVESIPLPPAGHAPVAPAATEAAWHAAVKAATLRWHPDKWVRLECMLSEEAERDSLKQLTQAMFRAVTRHKERGFRHARAATSAGAQ